MFFIIDCVPGGFIYYYRIYSNKRRGAYFIFRVSSAALIQGWRLFEGGAYLKGTYHKDKTFWV